MKLLLEEEAVYAIKIEARVYDTGTPIGYLQTLIEFAMQREDIKEELAKFIRSLRIEFSEL